ITHPERVEKLVILNMPHPNVFREHLKKNPVQRKKSSYILGLQLPFLPEWKMRRDNWRLPARSLRDTARPGTFTDADLALYREAWGQPGAVTGMLNWYRAALRARPATPASVRVQMPTLLLWGARDPFLGSEMAQPSIERCRDGRLVFLPEATHWVQHEEPAEVNRRIEEFFRSIPTH
ncbi:MAG TPA: alpha/beta hydrolase, partial [Thermoanaerobaculia bacterium]|nr:alpha/beta hydrolase [Thermoanaerobaculia bacterium]